MRSILTLLFSTILFSGCAVTTKVPDYLGGDVGVLAIPLELDNKGGGQILFDYYFHIKSTTSLSEYTISAKRLSSQFAYSKPLPTGTYQMDSIIQQFRKTVGQRANRNHVTTPLKTFPTFTIKKGEVTMLPWSFAVTHTKVDTHKHNTAWRFYSLDDSARKANRSSLESLLYATGWKTPSAQ